MITTILKVTIFFTNVQKNYYLIIDYMYFNLIIGNI